MASLTIAAKVSNEGTVTVPHEAVGALGLRPGDDVRIRIENTDTGTKSESAAQEALRHRLLQRLEEAHSLMREPSKPLSDPLEAEWAKGVEEKARRMGLKL